jgi:NAD(P)-dependent dehydrogenase (short-subunit alcohol dehydrogenase family)
MFDLTGKVAVVTGAGRSIGKAIALGLAQQGADVVVAARTSSEIEQTAAEIVAKGKRSLAVTTDVRFGEQVQNLINTAVQKFGKIDIMVNNAGALFGKSVVEMSEGAWDAVIRENLRSVFLCSNAVSKEMIKRQSGSIINISSISGIHGFTLNAAYGAAKAGIINFTISLAVELGKYNVRVNCISPGYVGHPGVLQAFDKPPVTTNPVPLGRLGTPEDIVGAAVYLASDSAGYTTGANIVIDGGLLYIPLVATDG